MPAACAQHREASEHESAASRRTHDGASHADGSTHVCSHRSRINEDDYCISSVFSWLSSDLSGKNCECLTPSVLVRMPGEYWTCGCGASMKYTWTVHDGIMFPSMRSLKRLVEKLSLCVLVYVRQICTRSMVHVHVFRSWKIHPVRSARTEHFLQK